MDLKTLLGRVRSDPTEMYFLGASAIYDDPISHLNVFGSSSGENVSRYASPVYEKLLENIKQLPLGAARTALVRQANNQVVQKDVAIVPMLLRMQIFGVKKNLKNFSVNPYQVIQLNELRR
jgi:ABC-type oligopeptide transport system substrate-binding subunit